MAKYDDFRGLDVLGHSLNAIRKGMGAFELLADSFLLAEGIGTDDGTGTLVMDVDSWYSLPAFLNAFDKIAAQIGEPALLNVGLTIPKTAVFPPSVTDVHSAIQSVDIAYHMNHGKNGRPLFDPATGQMDEGIGHYGYQMTPGKANSITSVCTGPYPCVFDRGILTAMAQRFKPSATVTHDDAKPCRKKGGSSCTYYVTWK